MSDLHLIMMLGGVVLERVPMDYSGLHSCADIMNYQERQAQKLIQAHRRDIYRTRLDPVFFVTGQRSRGNYMPTGDIEAGLTKEQLSIITQKSIL